jgi:Recombination endonuclease VII
MYASDACRKKGARKRERSFV